ncbi:MAG: TIR domain-containing protein [Rhodocyclaceae bacterium]|nr:TIR domain-containing protein [Rhodocyclaceae bacterium]
MTETVRSRLFISYSRADVAFTDELVAALEASGEFEILIDRAGIGHGEDWRARLGRLIVECDTLVFVLSPDSVGSEVCAWEIAEAQRHAKRIIPVLWRPVDFGAVPAGLSALNAVPFEGAHAVSGLPKLLTALKTDLGWLREHTRLGERAAEWAASGQAGAYLLRGDALAAAHAWLAAKPASAPPLTALQQDFLTASEADERQRLGVERARVSELAQAKAQAEAERDAAQQARASEARAARRVVRATTAGLVVALVLMVAALVAGRFAQDKAEEARRAADEAATARADAEARRKAAQLIQSRFLARAAQGELARGDAANAIGLARAALPADPAAPDRPFSVEAAQVIFDAYGHLHEQATLRGHGDAVNGALALPDGRIVSWSRDGTLRFWGPDGRPLKTVVAHRQPSAADQDTGVHGVLRLEDGRLLSWGVDKSARLWGEDGSDLGPFLTEADWIRIERLRDGRIAAIVGNEYRVWSAALAPQLTLKSPLPWLRGAILLRDGRFLTWQARIQFPGRHTAMLWGADGTPGPVLEGHERMLEGAFELADGSLVTFDQGTGLRIWTSAGELQAVVAKAHTHAAWLAPFGFPLADGRFYTWGQEAYQDHVWWARLWNTQGESQPLIEASDSPLQGMQLDDGRLLLGINSTTPALWHSDGTRGPLLSGHEAPPIAAAQWPDGRIATHGTDHTARLWSRDGVPLRVLRGHEGTVSGFEALPGDRYLTWSYSDRTARIWGEEARPRGLIRLAAGSARSVRALRDGALAMLTDDGVLALYAADLSPARVLRHEGREIDAWLELADGRLLTRGANHRNREPGPALRLWRANGEVLADLADPEVELLHAAQTPGGRILALDSTGRVRLWDGDGQPLADAAEGNAGQHLFGVHALADGRFVTRGGGNRLQLFSAEGAPGPTLDASDGLLPKAILPLAGDRLLIVDLRGPAVVWDTQTARARRLEIDDKSGVDAATPLPGQRILLSLNAGRLMILEADLSLTGTPLPNPDASAFQRQAVTRLADGRLLVASPLAGTHLRTADGAPDRPLTGYAVSGALLLQDGSFLVWPAASDRHALQIIGADGVPGVVLRGHGAEVRQAVQLDDGRVLSWADDASVRAWPGSLGQAVAWADEVVARLQPLTRAERCEHYLEPPETCASPAGR